jgi:GTP-binding protein Era
VIVEDLQMAGSLMRIKAMIYVEKDSQKGIVIGKEGKMLKKIGQEARERIERLFENKSYLELWVKVRKDWRKDDKSLKEFGYS